MEFNYQKKRKHTIGKLIVMSLATLLPIIAYFVLGAIYRFFNSPEKMDLVVLRLLVLIIFELAIAFKIVLYIRIIASEEFANKYFIKKNDVSEELIKEYEDKLPSEMIAFWKEFGFGTFYKGYLKSINPNEYKNLLEKSYFLGDVSIPIFATAFGDLITWEEDQYVGIVKYRYGVNDVICSGFDFFFDDLSEGELDDEYLSIKQYKAAIKKLGTLEYDECFGYVPLLALGGEESVNNLKKVKIREHIALITEISGEV